VCHFTLFSIIEYPIRQAFSIGNPKGSQLATICCLFDIPTPVHQGDFVLRLTEGVTRPADTLRTYVVTPQLVGCFDQPLDLIRSALEAHTSKGAYLHGSCGSGKSHFMAVVTLPLLHNP